MNDEVLERIKRFVSESQAIKPDRITRTTRLELDLGIYGDDAIELLVAYGKEFNVDISNFMAADYFSGEGLDIGELFGKLFKDEIPRKELTISDLEKGAIAGKLDEEVINGNK